jgi:hypothetical protein
MHGPLVLVVLLTLNSCWQRPFGVAHIGTILTGTCPLQHRQGVEPSACSSSRTTLRVRRVMAVPAPAQHRPKHCHRDGRKWLERNLTPFTFLYLLLLLRQSYHLI